MTLPPSIPVTGSPKGTRASYFVFTGETGRVRRPRDVATAAIGLLLLFWAVAAANSIPAWTESLSALVATSPQWVRVLLAIGYLVSLLYAVVVAVALLAGRRERTAAVRDVTVVVLATLAIVYLLSFLINGAWPYIFPEIDLQDPVPQFPVARVAMVTAMLLVVGPYVTRPLRRLGWAAIFLTALASVALSYGSPIHTVGSFGIGLFTAGLLLVIVGTPRGYPSPDAVSAGLDRLGVTNREIEADADQVWGLVRFTASSDRGPLDIKVHGRDSFDSQLASKIWRTLTYREMGQTISFSRLQSVEHEALVSLMAGRSGVSVRELAAVGTATSAMALIAYRAEGISLSSFDESPLTDEVLISAWHNVRVMHEAGISHGGLDIGAIRVDGAKTLLVDFALGSLAPGEDDLAGDVVELLFSMGSAYGAERAVRTAQAGLGTEALVAALPYLQVPAVSGRSRQQVDKPKKLIAELNEAVISATGAEKPEPVVLRRVTLKSLVTVGLILLVGSALIPLFTEVDYAEIWGVLESADWALIVIAVVVGHTQFFPQATATMFAVPSKLPFWPLITLQTASQFISLAIPSSAGRVAMNAAFLHKFGVSVTTAIAQGAIDGFSGFIVQVAILLLVLLTGNIDLGLSIDTSDIPWLLILGGIAAIIVMVVVVILRVHKFRDRVIPVIKQAWAALSIVLKQPSRALGLLASNFVYWNVLGLTLWLLLEAVGAPLTYGEALFVSAGTSLFAGFMPIPGGVGVAEAAMVALLATFGIDQSAAFAVTACFRVITFYLPALEGLFGTRWLERNDYI